MFRQFFVCFLCLSLIGVGIVPRTASAAEQGALTTEAELLEKYPNARVLHVSADEYRTLQKQLQRRGYRQADTLPLQLAEARIDAGVGVELEQDEEQYQEDDDCSQRGDDSAGEESFRLMLDFTEDAMNTSGNSSGDEAAVVFVIIGTVVVVIWALYVFKYLYDVSLGNMPCGRWHELAAVRNNVSNGPGQHAYFNGLRYSTGFREGALDVGIGFELGQADILFSEVGTLELQGRYWLLGPILRWRMTEAKNPSYFQMNFVGGTTEHDEVGMLARATLGLLFGIGDSMQLGLSWGAMNIDLNENEGIITERDQYHYLYGINLGFSF